MAQSTEVNVKWCASANGPVANITNMNLHSVFLNCRFCVTSRSNVSVFGVYVQICFLTLSYMLECHILPVFVVVPHIGNIYGIWFYDRDECARLGQLMNRC